MEFKLSSGEVVVIKPMTMRQAKACKFSNIINKIVKNAPKSEDDIDVATFDFTDEEILSVVMQFYPKAEDLSYSECIELFSAIISESFKKK